MRAALAIIAVAACLGGIVRWLDHNGPAVPPGIAWSNGPLEADEIDIDPRYAGRVAAMLNGEGDMVRAAQVVARLDTSGLDASLRQAEAQIAQAVQNIAAARAEQAQAAGQPKLASFAL